MTGFLSPRLARRSGAVVAVIGATALFIVPSSATERTEAFVASASAYGGRIEYSVPGFTVEQVIDGGGPVAQAYADSRATAVSFASLPYPGANALAVPGLL